MIVIEFHHLVALAVALIVSFFATPIVRKLAIKVGAVSIPKDSRRVHKRPMPLLGGLAIIAGFLLAVIYTFATRDFNDFIKFIAEPKTIGIIFGSLIIIGLGVYDDIKPLRARIKFPIQLIAAIIVVATGTKITTLSKPFLDTVAMHPSMMYFLGDVLAFAISVFWIVGLTNAINLIDGLDGLAAGVSGIAAISLFIVSVIRGQDDIAIVAATLIGALAGFLPYNFNPAKIFMGDTGATFLGFILAILSVEGTMKSVTVLSMAIPILVLGLPIFDTMFAIIRRLLHGKPIAQADRGHLHHRLLDMGLSHRMAVAILYVVSAALGLVSIALVDKGLLPSIILIIIIVVFGLGGARNLKEITITPEDENCKCQRTDEEEKDIENENQHEGIQNGEHEGIQNGELNNAQLEAAIGDKENQEKLNEEN
ncbi:MAG: glycosyltransferase family 4 protein [Acetivibrionales bacterium]|jgi:UDP-GlcNAc:undecaprenyl-phosphate GlcNAc-1-phosphate transferase